MRAIIAIVLIFILGGCSSFSPAHLFSGGGVGNTVYSADVAKESALQEAYSGLLCQDNGLPSFSAADGSPRCSYDQMDSSRWAILVNAGMYDIDRRCDAYLEWLYEMKNAKAPMAAQLTRTGSFASVLLKAFNASNLAIDLVAEVFGYAADTFTNFDPNLLFGVESSTIQTIVLTRQQEAKTAIHALSYSSKPEVMHALRGYLRVCMPFTIQTDINTTLAINARGIGERQAVVPIDSNTTGALNADDLVKKGDSFEPTPVAQLIFDPADSKGDGDVVWVQKVLCDPKPNGAVGPYTHFLISVVEENSDFPGFRKDGKLNTAEYNYVLEIGQNGGPCNTDLYRNSFEREYFANLSDFRLIAADLNKLLPNTPVPEETAYTDAGYPRATLRAKLAELRAKQIVVADDSVPADQMTRTLRRAIRAAANS